MKKIITLSILILEFCGYSFAQQLKVGQKIGDIELTNILNYPKDAIKFSELRGKLIILDFWGPACGACIDAFPKMEALQEKFEGKIQIIAVNRETIDSTRKFFIRHPRIKMPAIPFATGDKILKEMFPKNYVPWHVWIDSDRVVRYITDGYNATEDNISAVLNNQHPAISQLEYISDFDPKQPLFAQADQKYNDKVEYYSYISHCVSGASIGNRALKTEPGNKIRISRNCNSIVELYTAAYSEKGKYNFETKNSVILEVTDTFRYIRPKNAALIDVWKKKYSFDYDLVFPASKKDQLYKIMQQDLNRFFDLTASVEKRLVKSLVLVRINKKDPVINKDESGPNLQRKIYEDSLIQCYNKPFSTFFYSLSKILYYNGLETFLINETGYWDNLINIEISLSPLLSLDLCQLKEELNKYNLELVEETRPGDILIITKKVQEEN